MLFNRSWSDIGNEKDDHSCRSVSSIAISLSSRITSNRRDASTSDQKVSLWTHINPLPLGIELERFQGNQPAEYSMDRRWTIPSNESTGSTFLSASTCTYRGAQSLHTTFKQMYLHLTFRIFLHSFSLPDWNGRLHRHRVAILKHCFFFRSPSMFSFLSIHVVSLPENFSLFRYSQFDGRESSWSHNTRGTSPPFLLLTSALDSSLFSENSCSTGSQPSPLIMVPRHSFRSWPRNSILLCLQTKGISTICDPVI